MALGGEANKPLNPSWGSVLLGPRPPQAEVGIVKRPYNSKQWCGLVCGLVWSCGCVDSRAKRYCWRAWVRCVLLRGARDVRIFLDVDWAFLCPSRHTTAPFGSPTTQACIVKCNSSCTERKQGMVGEKQEHGPEAEATRLHCLPCMPPSSQATVIALYGLQTHALLHGNKCVLGNKSPDASYPFPW
jgi:hypothetical protein